MMWRETAWNGVRFDAPPAWDVATIGTRYLALSESGTPAMEIRWQTVGDAFSPGRILRRLRDRHGKSVREAPLPDAWRRGLTDFTATGFSWHAAETGGSGVILHCPACAQATLVQFFRTGPDAAPFDHPAAPRLLQTFRDHSSDGEVLWSIYDIRAVLPADFSLVRYRFEAGRFGLGFAAGDRRITLYRWGPATALLTKEGGLMQFAARVVPLPGQEMRERRAAGLETVEWATAPPEGGWAAFWGRFRREPGYRWFRLWHLPEKNRILGVGAEGRKPIPSDWLERICDHYESL